MRWYSCSPLGSDLHSSAWERLPGLIATAVSRRTKEGHEALVNVQREAIEVIEEEISFASLVVSKDIQRETAAKTCNNFRETRIPRQNGQLRENL